MLKKDLPVTSSSCDPVFEPYCNFSFDFFVFYDFNHPCKRIYKKNTNVNHFQIFGKDQITYHIGRSFHYCTKVAKFPCCLSNESIKHLIIREPKFITLLGNLKGKKKIVNCRFLNINDQYYLMVYHSLKLCCLQNKEFNNYKV